MSEKLYEKLKEVIKDLAENELDLIIDFELKLISERQRRKGETNYAK